MQLHSDSELHLWTWACINTNSTCIRMSDGVYCVKRAEKIIVQASVKVSIILFLCNICGNACKMKKKLAKFLYIQYIDDSFVRLSSDT